MLTDEEVEANRQGMASGLRGPFLSKWVSQLLADRDERVARERDREGLERAIAGALRDTIQAHGPITPEWIGSDARRVRCQLPNARAGAAPAKSASAQLAAADRAVD